MRDRVRQILESDAILGPLASLLGDEPSLFKDKLILRPPGTEGYGLHQDYAYYGWTGVPADQILAVQIAIDDADADTRFAAAVAGFGMQLRRSDYRGDWTLKNVLAVAKDAGGQDEFGLRAEFVTMVRKAKELMGQE